MQPPSASPASSKNCGTCIEGQISTISAHGDFLVSAVQTLAQKLLRAAISLHVQSSTAAAMHTGSNVKLLPLKNT